MNDHLAEILASQHAHKYLGRGTQTDPENGGTRHSDVAVADNGTAAALLDDMGICCNGGMGNPAITEGAQWLHLIHVKAAPIALSN